MNSSVARRALVVGAIPLALAVACSNAGEPAQVADGTATQASAPLTGSTGTPGGNSSPHNTARPGTAAPDPQGIDAAGPGILPSPRTAAAQPGVALPTGDQDHPIRVTTVQPGVTIPRPQPASPQPPSQLADYPVPANFRPVPNTRDAAPALDVQSLHAPTVVTPVLPIAPPPRTVRIGDFTTPAPDELPDTVVNGVNGVAADAEASLATGLNSIGVSPTRSDKIAAGTLAGAAAGATGGAVALGVPAAVAGGVPGAAAGALIGLGAGAAVGTVVAGGLTTGALGLAAATGGAGAVVAAVQSAAAAPEVAGFAGGGALIGAAVGGAAGAAAVGIPAAVVGGIAGGVGGAAVGGFLGGAL
ncbi:hypothetical protein [Nocardia sp. CA-145437]|uniref:hypothetical protein n=1 Tax=Nocardia sp. CA-145437 TaxID=3239980 RepID=UPI003D97AFC7